MGTEWHEVGEVCVCVCVCISFSFSSPFYSSSSSSCKVSNPSRTPVSSSYPACSTMNSQLMSLLLLPSHSPVCSTMNS